MKKKIELLAPARDLLCGIAAVDCGADAVYIGAGKFGARAAASNGRDVLFKLSNYAHRYNAKVYITLNTILFDNELEEARSYAWEAYEDGADALIIQDMGLLEIDMPPLPLIASTQADNRDWRKIRFLEEAGFYRAILARELSLDEIREIRSHTGIELECFIHGALCVSYSGRCLWSYAVSGRSGNRGVCSQPCRMYYSLYDGKGGKIEKDSYLFSLKDLNLSGHLGELIGAGVTSFKIEGRLKDENYIKNIVSFYRGKLDGILKEMDLLKTSSGECSTGFLPDPEKTFNRGYTDYFINGRKKGFATLRTQKSTGEYIGTVGDAGRGYFTMAPGGKALEKGDGICYYDGEGVLCGTLVNMVLEGRVYPFEGRFIKKGASIYRNRNSSFLKELVKSKPERKIPVIISCMQTAGGIELQAGDMEGSSVTLEFIMDIIEAKNPEEALSNIEKQLRKLGDTVYKASCIDIKMKKIPFIPIKDINRMRREIITKLDSERLKNYKRTLTKPAVNNYPYPEKVLDYTSNISNEKAALFYKRHGAAVTGKAAESVYDGGGIGLDGKLILKTRYCVRYELGMCGSHEDLVLSAGRMSFTLKFNCGTCEMEMYKNPGGRSGQKKQEVIL